MFLLSVEMARPRAYPLEALVEAGYGCSHIVLILMYRQQERGGSRKHTSSQKLKKRLRSGAGLAWRGIGIAQATAAIPMLSLSVAVSRAPVWRSTSRAQRVFAPSVQETYTSTPRCSS